MARAMWCAPASVFSFSLQHQLLKISVACKMIGSNCSTGSLAPKLCEFQLILSQGLRKQFDVQTDFAALPWVSWKKSSKAVQSAGSMPPTTADGHFQCRPWNLHFVPNGHQWIWRLYMTHTGLPGDSESHGFWAISQRFSKHFSPANHQAVSSLLKSVSAISRLGEGPGTCSRGKKSPAWHHGDLKWKKQIASR